MARCPSCGQENPEGFRFCGACGTELVAAPPSREVRKTVTVLFCDVAGSTAMGERLDPESTRRVMARYFDAMREAIERHGGTVEKFIGDAVMAAFGIPVVHEDDALRAVRAAADMRSALMELNEELERDWGVRIESRIGVNTGEVVSGEGDSIATGDAVNVAARLEQGAAPGETLLGESTHRLVRDAVTAEPVEPLAAKGKSEPVPAFRLTGLVEGAEFIPRRLDSPLVGRENELAQLQRAYDHAVSERVAYQFTLLGPAGIGKSRLVRELHDRIDSGLLSSRCLPYGEGITYWPLTELEALSSEIDFEANRDEIALQARRILERLARDQPLLVVFDDLQWAEPTFLDLIDHVTDLARDAPMLLLCVARPDLLDLRPGWGGGKLNATTMLLEALTEAESAQLVDNLLLARVNAGLTARIATAAEGNPLYLEEMLAMVAEGPNGDLAIPPTIQALLAARLDRLAPDERTAVECAAVQGQEFRHDALAHLLPDTLAERLPETHRSLVRKDLIRPTGDETFRFKHLLLRDAAYEALPKEQRADLHERFADWVADASPDLPEIIGYHFEQAYRYRTELGPADQRVRELGARAASLLASAGTKASERSDIHATMSLLERAVTLRSEDDPDAISLYPMLAYAVAETGDLERARELYGVAAQRGDPRTQLLARLRTTQLDLMQGASMNAAVPAVDRAMSEAAELGDDRVLAETLRRAGSLAIWLGDYERAESLLRQSLGHALSADAANDVSGAVLWLSVALLWGPTPADEGVEECRKLATIESARGVAHSELLVIQGALHALQGDFDLGRELGSRGRQRALELGRKVAYATLVQPAAMVELLAGEYAAAELLLREGRDILATAGERGHLSTIAGLLGQALALQGRLDEAQACAEEGAAAGAEDDFTTQLHVRVAKAQVAGRKGDLDEARRLATEIVAIGAYDKMDVPIAWVEIAEYLDAGERRSVLEQALAGAESKGNVVTAARARAMLEALA